MGFTQYSVKGKIVDAKTQIPIPDASIYFDGTTMGTISNSKGFFVLNYHQLTQAPLTISYMAFETLQFQISEEIADLGIIALEASTESLGEVMLEPDPWSREKKLNYFKRYFLGSSFEEKKCKILNEEALKLRYSVSSKKLYAEANTPLIIENKHLGYIINYDLKDFDLRFRRFKVPRKDKDSLVVYEPTTSYYIGASFFKELKKGNVKKRYLKRRQEMYLGSINHFMRSLYKKMLRENNYRIFFKKYETPAYQYLNVTPEQTLKKIHLKVSRLTVLYNNKKQSFVKVANNDPECVFYINSVGNFFPENNFYFGGEMGRQRLAQLLPLNYGL
jgi:hypothetical protein